MSYPTVLRPSNYANKITGEPFRNPEWEKQEYSSTLAGATTGTETIQISGLSEHLISVSIPEKTFTAGSASSVYYILPDDVFGEMPKTSYSQSIPAVLEDNSTVVVGQALLAYHNIPAVGLRYSVEIAPIAGNFTNGTACAILQTTFVFRISNN